jgi:ubiquinone/menaquinone biosynthesis C-methylase UbiE
MGPLTGAKVIELGCGSGHNLACLATHHGVTGIGVDHDPAKISRAHAAYGNLPGAHFTLADARHYLATAQPRSADLVVSIFGAFSFTDPLPLLRGTARACCGPAGGWP